VASSWEITEVESVMGTKVFIAEREGVLAGAAEVNPARTDPDDPLPPALEMIYVVPDWRAADGPGTALLARLKELFPGLSHTSVLSPTGRKFVERHGLPVRRPGAAAEELAANEAEEIGVRLLARARASKRLSRPSNP
jgi:hypothetical protein